jgi:hypothetical protein
MHISSLKIKKYAMTIQIPLPKHVPTIVGDGSPKANLSQPLSMDYLIIGHCGKLKYLSTNVVFFNFLMLGHWLAFQEGSNVTSQHDR